MEPDLIKLTFIQGLKDIVLNEIKQYSEIFIIETTDTEIYLSYFSNHHILRNLKSVIAVFLVGRDGSYNPFYISKHKSIIGNIVMEVIKHNPRAFTTFSLSCAGNQSKEVREIKRYIQDTFKLTKAEEADLEITIGKSDDVWEVAVRTTARPLSVRSYRVGHIPGGLNPTIAYAINVLCDLTHKQSYLNVFSGSATLLIEAAQINPHLKLIGFDYNGKTNALAIQNIKKAGLLRSIHLATKDIFDAPDFGTVDCITANLPFGMQIAKGEDLAKLYRAFVQYCEQHLTPDGVVGIYTTEHALLESILVDSKFAITKSIQLTLPTNVRSYIHPQILLCKLH